MASSKNIVLYVGQPTHETELAVQELNKHLKKKHRVAYVVNKRANIANTDLVKKADFFYKVDAKDITAVEKAIMPIIDSVVVVSCRNLWYMPLYGKMISLFPHLVMPTKDSIEATANKLVMRRKFRRYFPDITPKFTSVHSSKQEEVDKVKKFVGFPCIVKPASMGASRLVSICYHPEELQSTLRKTFRGLKSAYKKNNALVEPEVIVEEFMEGSTYSIDSYVDSEGNVKHLAPVHYKNGLDIGVDDFFTYRHLTPTRLSEDQLKEAFDVASKSIRALGLRSCMIHGEYVKLEDHWKVLEIDARMGGHRDLIYRESFGIPHGLNDLLTRMGEKPVIKHKVKKYTASFNIFPKKKGKIKSIKGLKKVRELKSLKQLIIKKKVGDMAGFAKQGFNKVLDITLTNENRSELLADIRRMEQAIVIEN